ncbi:MAG: hypothetical protein E7390_10125, partial [Ruminococcaceae bacterium]|nr:hypothetical protein [Oscillospiraceae bacterium]
GGVVKVAVNYFLVSNPAIHINGAPVGTIVCYVLILALNLISKKKILGVRYSLGDMLIRPLFSTLVMGGVVLLLHQMTHPLGRLLSVAVPICGGAAVYLVMLFCVRGIREEDVRLLPKGEALARILKRAKLLR